MRNCVSHHHACDCREELFKGILAENERLESENARLRHHLDELSKVADKGQIGHYGCHCELEPGQAPDGCVLDDGHPENCRYAPALVAAHKGREACHEWRKVETQNVEAEGLDAKVSGAGMASAE